MVGPQLASREHMEKRTVSALRFAFRLPCLLMERVNGFLLYAVSVAFALLYVLGGQYAALYPSSDRDRLDAQEVSNLIWCEIACVHICNLTR